MSATLMNSLTLAVSLLLLLAQLGVRHKRAVHLVFAVFCGSIALLMAKRIGAHHDGLPNYVQYLFGLGACATCNGYWLVARALFRSTQPFSFRHVVVASIVALLLLGDQGIKLMQALQWTAASAPPSAVQVGALELLRLLSSSLLVLAFWEAARGWSAATGADRRQRTIFMIAYGACVLSCTAGAKALHISLGEQAPVEAIAAFSALLMLVLTQWLILVRTAAPNVNESLTPPVEERVTVATEGESNTPIDEQDKPLAASLKAALIDERLYLQTDLKLVDIAKRFDVPEYRISRVLRYHLGARNFNQYINARRIEHAKTLLAHEESRHWPIVVIALESGFASVGPFSRSFKATVGCTPGEYRQQMCREPLPCFALSTEHRS